MMRIIIFETMKLPVGIIRWQDPLPRVTVIVKATFCFSGEEMTLAKEQAPLSTGDEYDDDTHGPEEIRYPTDFVPRKGAADVLIAGSAHATNPADRIDAMIGVDDWAYSFCALAGQSASHIPLRSPYLPYFNGTSGTRVGATKVDAVDVNAVHYGDFDFEHYNAAPAAQRLPMIEPTARIEIQGLSPRATRRVLHLPGLWPTLYVERFDNRIEHVQPVLDTLWLDTDHEQCVVVFREDFKVSSIESPNIERILVAFDNHSVAYEELLPRLARTRACLGIEPPIMSPEATDDDEADALKMAELETLEHAPEPKLDLPTYAQISAELGEKNEPREDVLRRHGLNEESWTLEERAWLGVMATGVSMEDEGTAIEMGQRFLEAQDELAKPQENAIDLADYAELTILVEEAEDPSKVLVARGMTMPEYMRIDRHFTEAMQQDESLAARFEQHVHRVRLQNSSDLETEA